MNYEGLSKKLNRMFDDLRIKPQALEEMEKSLRCHRNNVRRSEILIERYKYRCDLLESLLNKLPLDEKKIMLERNAHPRMKPTFYAERAHMPLARYEKKAKEASKKLADMLAEVPGWEEL